MGPVEVHVTSHESRFNDSSAALGRLRRVKCRGMLFFFSPDATMYFLPTLLTLAIVCGVLFTLWRELGVCELCVMCTLLLVAFVSSFLVISTDPGVYPRLRQGETDPLLDETGLVFCRVCLLRRPPRTSHCYLCNVCVMEHDHHCGILGGCVGQRSLRWFTLYLLAVSGAAAMGLFWICRSLFAAAFGTADGHRGAAAGSLVRVLNAKQSREADDVTSLVLALLLVILLLVVLLVGSFCLFYVYLVLTSMTRRESQRVRSRVCALVRPRWMWENLRHVVRPPPSMLSAQVNNNLVLL